MRQNTVDVFSVTDAVMLEAIDPLSLVMQRTEGAVLSQHQSRGRGLLIQTTARFPFHEGDHHTRRRTEKCNAELLLMVGLFIC